MTITVSRGNSRIAPRSRPKIADSRDIEEGVTVDFGEKGHIVGIEILDASDKLELSELVNISIENLPLEKLASSR